MGGWKKTWRGGWGMHNSFVKRETHGKIQKRYGERKKRRNVCFFVAGYNQRIFFFVQENFFLFPRCKVNIYYKEFLFFSLFLVSSFQRLNHQAEKGRERERERKNS
jgi:hypothetical protein